MFASTFVVVAAGLAAVAPSTLAMPVGPLSVNPPIKFVGCSLAGVRPPLPANPAPIVAPTADPSFVGLGIGVQNYTCSAATSTYTSAGAVAQLYDISCALGAFTPDQISTAAFDAWNAAPASLTIQQVIAGKSKISFRTPFAGILDKLVLGQHYFVPSPSGTGISPKWDFTSSGLTKGKSTAFVIGAKDAGIKDANTAANVDLLQLHGIQGSLATSIYRTATKGGQPPASCTPGTPDISLKYVARYDLIGSTVA